MSTPAPETEAPATETGDGEPAGMTFLEHLDELRSRVMHALIALVVGFLLCFPFARVLFEFLSRPLTRFLPPGETLAYTRLTEPFIVKLKVAALAGILAAAPYIAYQVWLFVAPGLYQKEKRYALPFVLASSGFFLAGAAFAYELLFPPVCKFFLEEGSPYKMMVTLDQYFSLLIWTVLGVALTFELPVLTGLLARLGVVRARFLIKNFHIAVVLCMVAAAFITPTPDAMTMLFVALPMVALFGISILVARVLEPKADDAGSDPPADGGGDGGTPA